MRKGQLNLQSFLHVILNEVSSWSMRRFSRPFGYDGNAKWISANTISDLFNPAASTLATKSVELFSIVAGTPARKIGERSPQLDYQLHYKPFLV